jgi:peroxiredoxin (alkyl hydroperoxide reductase subunit C)
MSVLVGRQAPDFTAAAVLKNGEIVSRYNLFEETKGKYIVLFFYPLNFTFVCPSEILAFASRTPKFEERNVELIGISIDSQFAHAAWRNTPVEKGGIGPVPFTLIADVDHAICRAYGIEGEGGVALRGSFLIDKLRTVQSQTVNNLALGRNVDEHLRTVDMLQYHEEYGEVCPAGWNKGDAAISATPAGIVAYLVDNAEAL